MTSVGIICEYNPLHLGHRKQIALLRQAFPEKCIVALMSGNFVQRGCPAIFDKELRARAAVLSGADLVLELPLSGALRSAEGFAAEGVRILSGLCDTLSFGAENPDREALMDCARILLREDYNEALKEALSTGRSFAAAREAALRKLGVSFPGFQQPNNILALEYTKAILQQNAPLQLFPIGREGSYHAQEADPENPSATSLRNLLLAGEDISAFVPAETAFLWQDAPIHDLMAGEQAVLYRLRTMRDEEFEALPFGSEGLWRKLMHESRRQDSLEGIFTAVKSKRYARARLQRMVICAVLGISQEMLYGTQPYTRILAFNDRGREFLSEQKKDSSLVNLGKAMEGPFWELEQRSDALYPLFRHHPPYPAVSSRDRRVFYHK